MRWQTKFYDFRFKSTATSGIGILLYSHLQHHNDTIIKQTQGQRRKKEDFFTIIFTSHFIARVRKGCSRFACERVLHILTPLLWPSRCVFLVLLMLRSTPSGVSEDPSVGCGFPYHIWSLTLWKSAGNCFGTPNSTELNNNSTPTRSPTGSLKLDV